LLLILGYYFAAAEDIGDTVVAAAVAADVGCNNRRLLIFL